MNRPSELDEILRRALTTFATESLNGSWNGRREREAISLFVFGHLLREVRPGGALFDSAQIGIEYPVPQLRDESPEGDNKASVRKDQVCKDLVIWPRPRMTCWDAKGNPTIAPSAILEWKFGTSRVHEGDVKWLSRFTREHPQCVGFTITANQVGEGDRLSCARLERGSATVDWLRIK